MRTLSNEEVMAVSGGVPAAIVPIAWAAGGGGALGGAFGALEYLGGNAVSGSATPGGLTFAVVRGGVIGALTSVGTALLTVSGGIVAGVTALGSAAAFATATSVGGATGVSDPNAKSD